MYISVMEMGFAHADSKMSNLLNMSKAMALVSVSTQSTFYLENKKSVASNMFGILVAL